MSMREFYKVAALTGLTGGLPEEEFEAVRTEIAKERKHAPLPPRIHTPRKSLTVRETGAPKQLRRQFVNPRSCADVLHITQLTPQGINPPSKPTQSDLDALPLDDGWDIPTERKQLDEADALKYFTRDQIEAMKLDRLNQLATLDRQRLGSVLNPILSLLDNLEADGKADPVAINELKDKIATCTGCRVVNPHLEEKEVQNTVELDNENPLTVGNYRPNALRALNKSNTMWSSRAPAPPNFTIDPRLMQTAMMDPAMLEPVMTDTVEETPSAPLCGVNWDFSGMWSKLFKRENTRQFRTSNVDENRLTDSRRGEEEGEFMLTPPLESLPTMMPMSEARKQKRPQDAPKDLEIGDNTMYINSLQPMILKANTTSKVTQRIPLRM